MEQKLSRPADSQDPRVGDFQRPVPPRAGDCDAELAGGDSTEPGNCHTPSTAIGATPLRASGGIEAQGKTNAEVYIVSIPSDWFPPVAGTFIKERMNDLVDLGEKMGADPSSWSTSPP